MHDIHSLEESTDEPSQLMRAFLSTQLQLFNMAMDAEKPRTIYPKTGKGKRVKRCSSSVPQCPRPGSMSPSKNNTIFVDYSKKNKNFDHVQQGYDSDMEDTGREYRTSGKEDSSSTPSTKRSRTENGSKTTHSSSSSTISSISGYLGLGSRKRKTPGNGGEDNNSVVFPFSSFRSGEGPSSPREREKYIFPRSKLNGVIRDSKGKSMLAEAGRQLLLKRKDNDLIDIAIAENDAKGYYEMTFFYAGGVPITDSDFAKATKTFQDRFRGMVVVPIELDDKEREDHAFGIMTQIILRLSCE